MKKFKKLVPAICMLLVSAVLMGTSTYAWFSMNTTVTATGMQIAAKSNATYLLIGSGENDTATEIQALADTANKTTAITVADSDAKVYPSAPALTTNEVAYLTTSGKDVDGATIATAGVQVANKATAAAVTNWYTASAEKSSAPTMKTDSARQLKSFDNYVIHKTVYLTVAKGANAANSLTVTGTITLKEYYLTTDTDVVTGKTYYTKSTSNNVDTYTAVTSPEKANISTYYEKSTATIITAVKVLIVSDNNQVVVIDSSKTTAQKLYGTTNANITDAGVHTVDIYVYYDGNDKSVYTNNMANLAGATIDLQFDVKVVE